ncbi:MAG: hypothetical protein KGL39_59320 [Patescibacteria group bacterium]|nr:hypothetical protein [Patescibacteria group bacterium]
MTDRDLLELAERAGFARDSFANADCSCEECNWAREPLRKFAALVRRGALEEAAQECDRITERTQRSHLWPT